MPASAPAVTAAETALAELKRLRPAAVVHSRGTVMGEELVLTTELTAPEVEAGRWKEGGEVQVMLSGTTGDVIATARGRLEPGSRAAVIRIPLNGAPGPFNAAIRLRGVTAGEAHDSVSVMRRQSLFGDPLIFRFALPSISRPVGSVYFRRTERMQIRWPVTATLERRDARILGRDGVPLELAVSLSDQEEGGRKFVVVDLNLGPLTAGEYIIELKGITEGKTESALLAFRVFR